MLNRKSQTVGEQGLAIQSDGNVTVHQSPTADQISEIIVGVSRQLAIFHAEGQKIVEERLEKFREEVIKEFEARESANPSAFQDPDFQYALGQAQKNFARTDDETICESLVNLLAERSVFDGRNRQSLILNQAIEAVGHLTAEEISTLTFLFILNRTRLTGNDIAEIKRHFAERLGVLAAGLSGNKSCYEYLVSQGCLTNNFGGATLREVLLRTHDLSWHKPFYMEELIEKKDKLPLDKVSNLLLKTEQGFVFVSPHTEALDDRLLQLQLQDMKPAVIDFIEQKKWSEAEKDQMFGEIFADFDELKARWDKASAGNYSITSLGIAVAHSNARRVLKDFTAPLSIWIN